MEGKDKLENRSLLRRKDNAIFICLWSIFVYTRTQVSETKWQEV